MPLIKQIPPYPPVKAPGVGREQGREGGLTGPIPTLQLVKPLCPPRRCSGRGRLSRVLVLLKEECPQHLTQFPPHYERAGQGEELCPQSVVMGVSWDCPVPRGKASKDPARPAPAS
jgi:hypothetical protein